MKKILVLALLLFAVTAAAQTNPGTWTGTIAVSGTAIPLAATHEGFRATTKTLYLASTEGPFYASFWRYDPNSSDADANGFKLVGPMSIAEPDTVVFIPQNMIYPVKIKCDHIFTSAPDLSPVVGVVYWYQ